MPACSGMASDHRRGAGFLTFLGTSAFTWVEQVLPVTPLDATKPAGVGVKLGRAAVRPTAGRVARAVKRGGTNGGQRRMATRPWPGRASDLLPRARRQAPVVLARRSPQDRLQRQPCRSVVFANFRIGDFVL